MGNRYVVGTDRGLDCIVGFSVLSLAVAPLKNSGIADRQLLLAAAHDLDGLCIHQVQRHAEEFAVAQYLVAKIADSKVFPVASS